MEGGKAIHRTRSRQFCKWDGCYQHCESFSIRDFGVNGWPRQREEKAFFCFRFSFEFPISVFVFFSLPTISFSVTLLGLLNSSCRVRNEFPCCVLLFMLSVQMCRLRNDLQTSLGASEPRGCRPRCTTSFVEDLIAADLK